MGTREGYCYHHVQAIMLAIDQYAESALGNREFFLNKPYAIGGKKDNVPEAPMNKKCPICFGIGWVCENHPDKPWDKELGRECGAGVPCECNRARARYRIAQVSEST
jgi:hypothetical protein